MPVSKTHVFNVEKGRVTVYINYCKGCGLCLAKCPKKSIKWSDYLCIYGTPAVEVDRERCNLCGQCALLCPDSAIDVEYVPRPKREWSA